MTPAQVMCRAALTLALALAMAGPFAADTPPPGAKPAPKTIQPKKSPPAAANPAAAAPTPAPAPARRTAAGPLGSVLEYGYYNVEVEGDRYKDQSAPSGEVVAGLTVKLASLTDVVPLEKGRLFGFRFRISGLESRGNHVEVRQVVKHPRMRRPDNTVSTGYETKLGLNVRLGEVTDYAGYRLDHDYELVEGEWVFEFWLDDQKLLEQKFTTVRQVSHR